MVINLEEWQTFYVIVGSSAAALTGLQFVVIALSAEHATAGGEEAVQAFGTPTIVHFCAVLTTGAIVAVPKHSAFSLSLCLSVLGIAGIVYGIRTAIRAQRQDGYSPVFEDWLWHVALPILAYATLLAAGLAGFTHVAGALYVTAASALSLLLIGIHNAWDSAVFISTNKQDGERGASSK